MTEAGYHIFYFPLHYNHGVHLIKMNNTLVIVFAEIPERIEYTPGSGQRVLFPDAELQLCDVPCETRNVSIQLSMVTNHIGKGCDRDTYSVESQRKLCGKPFSISTSTSCACPSQEHVSSAQGFVNTDAHCDFLSNDSLELSESESITIFLYQFLI